MTTTSAASRGPEAGPVHHFSDEMLMDYATGGCGEAEALLIACHLVLCPDCRARVEDLEKLGGAMLSEVEPVALADGSLEAMLARLDDDASEVETVPRRHAVPEPGRIAVPGPLADALGGVAIEALHWRTVIRGIEEVELGWGRHGTRTKLLRIKAGTAVPQHTHAGNELTLVLSGGFSDERGHFTRGDVALSDPDIDHRPVADEDADCICLTVTDAPLKLTGRIGRWLNPFIRI